MHTSMETAPKMALREPDAVRCAPQRPFNESLQAEAITYLMHEREADASAELSKGGLHSLAMRREQTLVPPELLMELKDGEQADASVALPEKLNPCTCTTAAFDEWLRAVVKSIPAPAEAADAVQRRNCCGSRTICGRARPGGVTGVSRQQALYRALEVLEAATRLLQRHAVLCRGRSRLLHAYYDALEEDIHQHAVSVSASTATRGTVQPTAEIQLQQLLPPEQHKYSPFHYHLRLYKRGAPLHHYTQEQEKLQSRLEKVYYVLLKLEEVEGLSNSILVEGQATSLLAQQRRQSTDALQGGSTKAGSIMRANPTLQFSRRLVGMERRVRRLRQQLRLPLPVSEVTSRLRNELILSFSARVLALREPAPFTSEIYVTSAAPAASPSPQAAPRPPGDGAHHQSSHSISAFVEWYVQRVMDPLAISQLLSIVPREYVVTTTCRLVYACEAHASLRSSRALPDLGPVLLRAVAEGRADAVAQLLLSSSVSYGSVLSHPVDCHTCFFAGLLGGQIDVLARLVEQQSWNVNALHVLLFMSAPWNIAAAPTAVMSSRGCYVYQQALVERVQAFLSVAEQVLAARSQEPAYKLPLSLEENATDAASMSTIAGGADYEADESALAALRKAQLLDVSAEGEKLLAALGCFLGSAAASASINDDALRGGRHGSQRSTHAGKPVTTANASMARGGGMKKKAEDASDADDDGITGSTGVSAFGALSMSAASRAAPPLPPVFLKGALHRLQLFLAVRNAMLQYERQRQDAQWETLLGKVKARPSSGDGASSAAASTMHGLGSSGKNLARLHAKAPPLLQGAAAANPRTDHREAPLASAVAAPYSFVQILQQHQLDALTAGALCPLRCQMCPAFTTPQLQRVDAWSYGPLQPTTAITTALGTARGTGNEGGAKHSSRELISLAERVNTLIGIGEDDCRPDENLRGRLNRSLSSLSPRSRPITALLMRSDTAIDMMASSWYVHANISQANFVEEHGHYGSSSNGNGERQTARGAHLHRLMNPWQARSATGLLMSALPFRYSLSMPLEDVRRAAQDAKQRRALRTLYGSSAAGAADKSVSDHDDGGDRSDDHHPRRGGTGTAAENLASLYVHRATPPPAKPSFYYEVQMSVEYLVAMHAADYLGATPLAIGSEALARGASSPLSEDAMHRLCENCVIVGLCNPITAAQANGCTHSPSQPYVVTHLGHESTATAAVVEPGEASTTPSDDDADIDVLYLGVWKHQRNSVRAVTAMQASPHHVDGDAADACANAAPVYLRLELPRWSHPAPAKEAGTTAAQDAPRDRVAAANGNPAHAAETNAATAAATASTNMWLPIITRACQDDVTRAVAKARQQQQAEAAQGTAANQASERARKSRCGATSPSLPASPFASLTRVRCEVAATLVLGLLLDPSAGTLRLRLNNYTDFEEITLGLWLGSVAEATAATASAPPPPPAPKPRLYPAATLSLNDCGWRSWPSSPSSLLSVSNAVLRFSFDAAELLFGPPPPRQAVRITSADAIMPAGKAARMSHQQRRVSEPIGAKAPHSVVPPFQASQPIALLDSTVKFTEMLSVLTDVSLLAATKRSGDKNQQQQQLHSLGHGDDAADEDEEGEVDGVDATAPQGAAPPAHSSLLLIGSRDRRTHAAMMRVQRLLNTPGGGATGTTAGSSSAFNNSDLADIFYPPVRIYRHSCHCPAHELYPLPSSSSLGAADKDDASERSRRTQKCQRCLANRRIGLSSAGETVDEESACDAYARQQQPQQRRAALYAACALGYMEVVQVLLERIPVEELLSYFGLVIESEARAALQRCYAVANTVFLRNYRLRSLATQSPSSPSGGTAVETSAPANGDQDDEGVEEGSYVDVDTEEARMSSLNARLGKQTACVTVLLNCLYDLLCVASASNTTARKAQNTAELVHPPHSTKSHGREEDVLGGEAQARRPSSAGRELLVDALNLQSPTGEAALLIAVRHNNVAVALRLLKLGAQPACMDRITRLLSLELACANRCTPIAEALLQSHNGGGAVYATSPVLLNHAGIATALCWCAINNMPAIMQKLLECDGIDAESGFEGSSPLHLAIAFGSEAAALTLLNGTQPRKTATISARKGSGGRAEAPPAALVAAATAAPDTKTASLAAKHVNCGSSQRGTAAPSASPARPTETVSAAETHKKPFMDVNILHERTHCTPLHLACERGQLRIIRTLLQSWHAQLNIAAAYTNYTPLLTAVANGQEEAALRILEYSKDELRRGRQCWISARSISTATPRCTWLRYMLVQFSEEEVARLVALHPTLRASPAYQAATCIVPLHAVNKHGKTALLVALQYNQADTAELLVSMLIDSAETLEVGTPRRRLEIGGPLIEGTCMALHQAHRKHLDSVVQLMLSAPPSLFPCTAAFCKSVQLYKQQQADGRRSGALLRSETCDGDVRPAFVADASTVPVLASERNENASQRSPAMAQDRGSFVRLLLTRAAGPTIAPNDALRVLLRGFALPELCVYLSEVAAESAVLGVQRSTAMADAELVIGYLQEHAGSVVAPTRAVLFCRDVWLCLQQWMYSEASAERERAAVSRAHHAFSSRTTDSTYSQLSVGIEKGGERRQKQQQQCELEEAPMGWLCRMLLVPKSGVGSHAHGKAAQPKSALPASASNSSALSADASSAAQEAEHYRHALEATLNRKTLSLEVARMIRLYGRSHGGARAIEEIKSIVAAYVRAHINEPAAHVRLTTAAATAAAVATSATLSSSSKHSSFSVRTRSRAQSFRDVVEQHATWNRDGTVDLDATEREFSDRNSIDVIGNEPLFTTPMGFTVLQLAATLGLPEVVAFLVDTYNLNPLYAPAQGMHTCVPQSTTPPPQANRSKEGTRKEEAARVRNVVVHSVRAVVGVASPCAGRGDYGGANGSAGKSREDAGLWICWTPYRLAVRSGNLHIVKTLLLAGSGAAPAVAEINPRELCGTSTLARLSHSDRHVEDGVTFSGAGATVSTAICPAASLVDYKEPAWLDPYQRTALQESIVVATSVVTKTAPSLSEALALVRLLLKHGAQSNGLFDSTGSDAWLLAMAGSGAADLPITHYSYAADCKRRPYSAGSEASLSQLSLTGASAPATASLALIRTTAGEAAGQRCVDLLRLRAPLLGCAPATLRRADTHLDGRRLDGPQESAESDCFNEQLLRHPRRLLHQWRRLPCMQLAPTRAAAAGFARRGRRAAGTVGNVHDGSGSDEGNDAAGEDGDGAAAQGYSVFEQADALCAQYEKVQQTLHPSAAMAIPRVGGGVRPCTPSPQATALATTVSFASLLTITSAEEVTLLPSAVAPGGAVTLNRRVLAGGSVSRTNSVAGRETGTSPLTPSFSADSLKTRLIAALRLCYRVVLLYTCVEYTPLQLLRLVRAFGAAAIPVSARHPLSGDSVATRLLRKTHAHLLARTSGGGGGGDSSTSNTLRGELGSDAASVMMRGADDMSQLPLSVLKEPPCTDDPAADAETRALVDTCVALVHMLRDAALRLPSPPSAPQSQAAATAAGQALRSVLFQPSCDGETALSLAARIAHAPLISVLVQSGAAVSSASHNRSQGGDESWRCSRTTCSVPWRGDGSDTEAGGEAVLACTTSPGFRTNLADVVVRVLLATRVYYPAHEIGTVRALLTHMPNEPARRAFLRGVYPNIHPLPALQLAMDNVSIASGFLTSPDCMNALWTNLLYAHFTGQLDTAVRTTAKAWSELLHVVLPGAPAVPIYLVMCAAVREEVSAEELKASHSGVRAQSPQVTPSPPQSLAGSTRSSSMVKKRSKERTVPSAIPNWSHVVRRTNLFLQLMAMSAAETLMSKGSKPSSHVSADARTLSSTAAAASGSGQRTKSASSPLHEVTKKGSFAALTDVGEPPLHGLSGTLLWDTIELAVRYDDKDMLRHLLQLRLPDIVLTHIGNIQSQQQTLSSTGTFGRAYSSMDVSARAMEAVSKTILDSYPSFAGVSTTSQATLVLERLQRLLWREALQERHVDLLAVAAGSIETLRFLYTSSPPEVRAQMTPMRYDRVDVKSGMPEGVSPAPDIVAPAAAVPAGAEELLGSFQKLRKSSSARVGSGVMSPSPQVFVVSSKVETHATAAHQLTKTPFSASTASATPSADGVARLAVLTPETPTSPVSPAAKRTSPALAVDIVETPDERSLTLPLADAPLLQPKASEDKEEESAAAVADAELRFMESCVQNGRRRLAPGEERRRCVTAVTWGLGAAACSVKLPMVQSSARAVSASTAGTAEAATAPGTRVEVQPRRTPSLLPQLPRPPAQRRITLDGKIGDVGPVKDSHQAIADGEKTAARQVVQRRGRAKTSLPTKASAAAKEASGPAPSSPTPPAVVEPEPRVALSVPVLDLFLAGTVAPSSAEAAAPQQHSSDAYARQEVALSLRYQTRAHLDTLLHLLVLHDQCQLAEYYLEYCHFWFVSNELDPEPVSGRPGRFPIGQPPASPDGDSSEDDLNDDDAHLCSDVRYIGHDKQKRSTRSSQQFRHRSRGSSSSAYAGTVPREFLRCMLRVNAHGLTAFDYAHTPAMLQLLEWYGCVPPTYRPNPHAFRRVVFLNRGGHGDVREAYTFADNMDDHDNDEAVDRRQSASVRTSMMARRKREVLRFFPVPRLVLATDNFVALLDPTGTELASTVGSVATAQARTAASGTADGRRCNGEDDADESLAKNEVLVSTRTQPLQLSDRRIDAMISTERRQLQVSERRHHQQERARALLFEQVAAQSQALQWELQRHPPCSKMTLWHNALEAQRLSGSAFTATSSRGRLKRRAEGGARGSNGGGAGEVSLLHLGLCSFEDELVRLYGELHTASASASAAATRTPEGGAISDGDNAASVLSAYSRLLLPPSVTGKPATHPHQGLEEVKRSYGMMSGDAPPETDKSNSSPRTKASRTGCTVLPRVSFPGGSIGGALSPTQQGNKPSSVSAANAFMAASQDFRSCGRAPALPPRLSQMDVVFLLECQQFVVYPLSMPSTGDAVEVVNDGGDDTYDESSKPRSSAKGGGGLSDSIGNSSRTPSNDEGNVAPPRLSLGKGAASFSELPAVIERCTGGSIGTDEQRVKGAGKDAPRQRAPALATTTRDIAGRSPASPHRSPARREHGDRIRDAPPSDLPLLRSLLARKAADDLSSELIDVSAHRYEAALLVSLTPMLLSGISGDGAPGARVSAAATMRNLAAKLMHTRWKQFGSRPIISGTNTDAATTATEAVALLNVPPFTLADAPALYPSGAPFSASPAADEPGSVASTTALGAAAARVPTVIAARLEEWVARRWPLQRQAPPSPKLHRKAGGRAGTTSSRSPPTKTIKACRQENEDENTQDRNGVDADGYDDESAATSVLDRIEPVGGVATAAQQVLMRALLKRFTAATGAQLSEQMGLVITPNYDVAEVGDTAAALRDIEAKAQKENGSSAASIALFTPLGPNSRVCQMELQTQPRFCPPRPRPYAASLVWMCLACGQLAPYEAAPHYSMESIDGLDNSLQGTSSAMNAMPGGFDVTTALSDCEAAAHAYKSSPPNTAQHLFGHSQCGGVTGSTAAAAATSASSPTASRSPRQEQRHSCVNNASDSYLSQAASLCADEKTLGDGEILVCDGISSSHCRRAPTTVSTTLGSTSNESSTLAVTPCKPAVAALPQLSAASSSLWRDAGVRGVQNLSSSGARSRQQEDDAACSLAVLLMEEHLMGTTVESEHEHWKAILSHSCRSTAIRRDGGAAAVYGPFTSHALYSGNESQPLGVLAPAAENGCKPPETAQAETRKEIPSVHLAVALFLARLLSKVKVMAVTALGNFHPLSPALPKTYFSSHGSEHGDKAAIRGYGNGVLASDSAPRSASSISRLPRRAQEGCRPSYPLYNPSEGMRTSSDHWKSLSASTATSRTSPPACASAEECTLPCLASLLGVTGGGASEDLYGISLDSSAQPSWVFTAPDEEETYRAEDDEGLVIQHQRGGVQSDEDASAVGAEDAHTCARMLYDDSTAASNIMGTTAAAATTMRACKDKWSSISVSEALWRLVLPSFSAPFLSTTSMPSTAAAAARATSVHRAFSAGGSRPLESLMGWIASAPRRGAVESTASSAVVTGTRPYRGFRGDVEEAVRQLDAAQLEVAKLRLQQVLAAVMAEQLRREGQSEGEYPT
ncbi:Ankyrin repeats (3 copies) family protein [Leishmania donovani]|uniref:Ankyrin repeats (3 copies) family protein n=1 Tax=Leishmania donovani TaxID=5661 RepID=A0A504X9S0_LEIDO|nr:Ankyrin repeats (3 copies) family protein [Leishmania donovani]